MEATELNNTELLALAGLTLHLASADGKVTQEEAKELKDLGEELGGADRFSNAIGEAEARFKTEQDALDFASTIDRQYARDFIYTVLSDLAHSDEMHPTEADLLARIRLMWGLRGAS